MLVRVFPTSVGLRRFATFGVWHLRQVVRTFLVYKNCFLPSHTFVVSTPVTPKRYRPLTANGRDEHNSKPVSPGKGPMVNYYSMAIVVTERLGTLQGDVTDSTQSDCLASVTQHQFASCRPPTQRVEPPRHVMPSLHVSCHVAVSLCVLLENARMARTPATSSLYTPFSVSIN